MALTGSQRCVSEGRYIAPCGASPLPGVIMGTGDLSGKFSEVQREEGERLPAMDLNHIFWEKQYLLCTKTVDSVGGAL